MARSVSDHLRRIERRIPAAAASIALLAAACLPRTTPAPDLRTSVTTVYACAGDYRFSAHEIGSVATLRLPTTTIALPRAGSESGTRYASGDTVFWHRGETATLTIDGRSRTDCRGEVAETPWDEARLLGVDYRAAGYEPAWSLEMQAGRHMRFLMDGRSAVYLPIPEPVTNGRTTSYRASGELDLEVTIEETQCIDPTSAAPLPHTVVVLVGGIGYRGCGQPLGD